MTFAEDVWVVGLLGALLLALYIFTRYRRRTRDYHQSRLYKERLPSWLKQFEVFVFAALMTASTIAVAFVYFSVLGRALTKKATSSGASGIYFALGAGLIAIPTALLLANLISWVIPPVRKANLAAMEGLDVSFWTANRGLLLFGAVSAPLGIILLVVAALEPWRG